MTCGRSDWKFFFDTLFPVGAILLYAFITPLKESPKLYGSLYAFLIILSLLLWYICYHYAMNHHTIIFLENRKDKTNFFKRNKDDTFKIVLGAIIGVVVVKFVEWIFK